MVREGNSTALREGTEECNSEASDFFLEKFPVPEEPLPHSPLPPPWRLHRPGPRREPQQVLEETSGLCGCGDEWALSGPEQPLAPLDFAWSPSPEEGASSLPRLFQRKRGDALAAYLRSKYTTVSGSCTVSFYSFAHKWSGAAVLLTVLYILGYFQWRWVRRQPSAC